MQFLCMYMSLNKDRIFCVWIPVHLCRLPHVSDALAVPRAMEAYITTFFSCKECRQNFVKELQKYPYQNLVFTNKEAVLWLWDVHNEVNRRWDNISSKRGAFVFTAYLSNFFRGLATSTLCLIWYSWFWNLIVLVLLVIGMSVYVILPFSSSDHFLARIFVVIVFPLLSHYVEMDILTEWNNDATHACSNSKFHILSVNPLFTAE